MHVIGIDSAAARRATVTSLAGVLLIAACTRDSSKGSSAAASGGKAERAEVAWAAPVSLTADKGGGAAPVFAASKAGKLALAWVSAPNGGNDGRLYVHDHINADTVRGSDASELRDPLGSLSIYGEVPPKVAYAPDGSLYAAYLVTKV